MTITAETMLQQLRDIAEKAMANNGGVDFIYEKPRDGYGHAAGNCRYVHYDEDGQASPGCIVAVWAHQDLNIELNRLQNFEGSGATCLLRDCVPQSTNVVQDIAHRVQNLQDNGVGWLAAVERIQTSYDAGQYM